METLDDLWRLPNVDRPGFDFLETTEFIQRCGLATSYLEFLLSRMLHLALAHSHLYHGAGRAHFADEADSHGSQQGVLSHN